MQTINDRTEVIVIGGGVAGLTTAALVGRQGKSVRLLEQAAGLGGRARTREQNGFFLNIGAHALYRGGRGIEVLRGLGIEPKGKMAATANAYAVHQGVKYTLPGGLVSLLTTSLFGVSAKVETARFLGSIQKLDSRAWLNVSLREWLDKEVSHQEVRELLQSVCQLATYTNAPDIMSAGVAIDQVQKALGKGVLYLDEGWQSLVDSLREVAEAAGAVMETGVKVAAVERAAGGAVRGVRLADGRFYESDIVVIASSPQLAATLVEKSENTSLARWAAEAIPVKAACLDIGLNRLPVAKATFALGIDKPLYLSVHSAAAHLAPEGGALIHLLKYLPVNDDRVDEGVEGELEQLLGLIQPGWREALVQRRFLPSVVVAHAVTTAGNNGTEGRPEPEVREVGGLFVVGDWVGKEGLLADASFASASRAAEMIAASQPVSRAIAV
jgi:phytoene dehydrogenase-like protein